MEQVAEAALDVRALDLAFTIVQEIRKKFPETQRAQRITVSPPPPPPLPPLSPSPPIAKGVPL